MIGEKAKFIGYKKIKIEDLVRCPLNPRNDYGNLEELTDTIVEDGVLDDLVVRAKDGKYEVICGERRRLAAENATLEEVNCKIYEMSDSIARRWMAIEDYQKEIWQPFERGKFYNDWKEKENLTFEDLASIIGCDASTIKDYSKFAKEIVPSVGEKVAVATRYGVSEAKTLSFNKARKLTSLAPEVQKELASKITANGMNEKEVAKKVKDIQEIGALINRPQTSKEDKEKLTKEILDDPETLVSTEPWEVRHKLGIEEPAKEDRPHEKVLAQIKKYCSKIQETTGAELKGDDIIIHLKKYQSKKEED